MTKKGFDKTIEKQTNKRTLYFIVQERKSNDNKTKVETTSGRVYEPIGESIKSGPLSVGFNVDNLLKVRRGRNVYELHTL